MNITVIIKSHEYTALEPYQHQLLAALVQEHSHKLNVVELDKLQGLTNVDVDAAFLMLPVRHIVQNIFKFVKVLKEVPVIIADYDPWVFFEDGSAHKGAYDILMQSLNVKKFFIPNQTWCDILYHKDYPVVFSQIGMSPSYCQTTSFDSRSIKLEFRGSSYPVREKQFQRLKNAGLDVPWPKNKIAPYPGFLKHLQSIQCWAQNEDENITVDGEVLQFRNWLWPKAMEVLSQGCFLIRNRDTESLNYGAEGLPTVFLFDDISKARDCYENIMSMSLAEKNQRSQETIALIKKRDVYNVIAKSLVGWFYDD